MPYDGEFAQYRSIRRLAESEKVRNLLGSYQVRMPTDQQQPLAELLSETAPSDWKPKFVLAIDGSHVEVTVRNGFPGAEASYVTVASVLLDMAKTAELDVARPVDPKEFRKTEQADSIDCALPGCNVVGTGDSSADESFRRKVFEVLASVRIVEDGESLLDTYEALLQYKPTGAREQSCPYSDCQSPDRTFIRGRGRYHCTCSKKHDLFSPDALRIHEGMNSAGTNGAMFAEIMQVLERLWIVHILRVMEAKKWLGMLRQIAFVIDGPLAVFGHPAWLSQAISQELSRINQVTLKWTDDKDLLILGIEKSGMFVEHFGQIDEDEHGQTTRFPSQRALLLDDGYIKRNVIFSDSDKPYGQDTYFGRKFLYKAQSGARIVATLPFLTEEHRDTQTALPQQFPRLNDAMSVLDRLVSSRYPNSLAPLISAHAEAAIPLNLGKRVLEQLARQLITEENV
jgi:hypothetical protein